MIDDTFLIGLIRDYGLLVLAPLALLEGPIVSVFGGYLAGRGLVPFNALLVLVVVADLVGDVMLYGIGRHGGRRVPQRWRGRLGLSPERQERLVDEIHTHGTRMLAVGKLTHAMGFAVLTAAGAARFPFGRFVMVNLLATLPKSAAMVALGWWLGNSWQRADAWLTRAIAVGGVLALVALVLWHLRARKRDAA